MPITYLDEEPRKFKITYLDDEPISKTEQLIKSRPNQFDESNAGFLQKVWNRTPLGQTMQMMPSIESAIANPLLELQAGKPENALTAMMQGITQQRRGERGDIFRNVGVPEPIAATLGVISDPTALIGGIGNKAVGLAGTGAKAGAKAVTGAVKGVAETASNIKNIDKFSSAVRNSMFKLKSDTGKQIDEGITALSKNNPTKRIDLSSEMTELKNALDNPENAGLMADVKGIIRRIKDPEMVKKLTRMIERPDYARNLTLRTAEDIKRAISQAPSISTKLGNRFANWTHGDMEMLDLLDNIKLRESEVFPELKDVRAPYAEFMQNYKQVKNYFKPQSLETKIKGKFGTKEIENAAEKVIPKDKAKQIKNVRQMLGALKVMKDIVKASAIGGGALAGGKLLFGDK